MLHALKKSLLRLIALGAVLYAGFMLVWDMHQAGGVFRMTDPTGSFGATFVLMGIVANLSVLFAFVVLIRHAIINHTVRDRMPMPYVVIFTLKMFEAAMLGPCLGITADDPGSECGVVSIFASYLTSPIIIAMAGQIVLRTADRRVRLAGLGMLGVLAVAGLAAWGMLTPKNANDCTLMPEIKDRAACVERYALSRADINICRAIDFRTVQYDCMNKVARMKRDPSLCAQIQTPSGADVSHYEVTADQARDFCYYTLAFDLHNPLLCDRIQSVEARAVCASRLPPLQSVPHAALPALPRSLPHGQPQPQSQPSAGNVPKTGAP